MLIVSSLGCGIMSGMANGFLSLEYSLDNYISDMKYPDAVVETKITTREVLDDVSSIPGVEAADARLIGNLIMVANNGIHYSMQAMTFSEEEFQGTYYWEKSEEEAGYPVLLEKRFSELNDIHAGDPVEIRADDRSWKCYVSAVISRPEMIAVHQLGDMRVLSTDIGYIYIPSGLLDTVDNPDYDDAASEWEENNQEFIKQKKDATDEYDKILAEINDAEELLKKKKAELDEQLKTAGAKKKELLKYREEIEKKNAELKEKEAELLEKKQQIEQGEEELKKAEAEAAAGREELNEKKELLDSTKAELESKKSELQVQLRELDKKEEELKKTKAEVLKAKEEIEKNLRDLKEKEGQAQEAKEQLLMTLTPLTIIREILVILKEQVSFIDEFIREAENYVDLYEWAEDAVAQLDKILADTERVEQLLKELKEGIIAVDEEIARAKAEGRDVTDLIEKRQQLIDFLETIGISEDDLDSAIAVFQTIIDELHNNRDTLVRLLEEGSSPEKIDEMRVAIINEMNAILERYASGYNFSEAVFNGLIAEIDAAIKEINSGIQQLDEALSQIAEGRALLLEKQKEVESGLSQITEGEKQINEGRAAITEGLSQIEAGLTEVAAGYEELGRYTKQLEEGENKITQGRAELEEYNRQYNEAKELLLESKNALIDALNEVENGIRQIDDAVKDGKNKLRDGEQELTRNRNEANDKWLDFLSNFKEFEEELRKAKEELGEWKGYGVFCNQFLLRFEPGADIDAVLAEVENVLGRDNIKDSYTYEDSPVKRIIDENLDPLKTMALYVPMLFFAVALIVEFLFMSFLIRQCRREIGILRALGYSRNGIVGLFCIVNVMASAGAIALGFAIGSGVSNFISSFFQKYFWLYTYDYTVHWSRVWISIGLTVIVGLVATIVSAQYISRIKPSEAMSRPAPQTFSEKRGVLSRLNISPFVKYCISSLLRNKGRLLFSIICLSSSVVLIFAAFSFDFSKNRILTDEFEDRIHYDCEIFLASEPDEEFLEELTSSGLAEDIETVGYFSREIEGNGASKEMIIKGISPDSKLLGIHDSDRNEMHVSDDGMLLEKHTAELLNVSEGDTVLAGGTPVLVTGIHDECQHRFHYISSNLMSRLGEADMYSVICKVKKENEVPLMELLSEEEDYIYAAFTSRIYAGIEDGFQAFGICAIIILVFSVVIGLIIVVNTLRTNLQDQKKDLCILRTLGFQYSGLSLRLMTQAAVYYLFSCVIGIPVGILVTNIALNRLEIEDRSYPFVNDYRIYLLTLLLVLGYIVLSHFISVRTIKKWNLVETVKDKE